MPDNESSIIHTYKVFTVYHSIVLTASVLQWRTAIYQAAPSSSRWATSERLVIQPNDGPFIKMICYNASIHKNAKNKGRGLCAENKPVKKKLILEYIKDGDSLSISPEPLALALLHRWSWSNKGPRDCPRGSIAVSSCFARFTTSHYRFHNFYDPNNFTLAKVSFQ